MVTKEGDIVIYCGQVGIITYALTHYSTIMYVTGESDSVENAALQRPTKKEILAYKLGGVSNDFQQAIYELTSI